MKKKTYSTNFKYNDPVWILLVVPPYKYVTAKTYVYISNYQIYMSL